jgi:serine/threonine protein kinase
MATKRKDREYTPGERIPGTEYIVIRLEARGGHGALYLVRHHFLEKKLQMLKTLRALEPNPDLMARLKREAQLLAGMQHPNIVSVVGGGITDEPDPRPYFVMERLRGYSLASILNMPGERRGVGMDAGFQILIEMCDAFQYIHERDVIHRDVKPDNIFLERVLPTGSNTKLLDFGVLHVLSTEKRQTLERMFIGTFRYAAPELLFGDRPSPQTDLYALGLVGYEIITGHHPFEACKTTEAIAKAHIETEPPPFPRDKLYPEGLEPLILHMLRKKPADRPKSAEWVGVQLRQIRLQAEIRQGTFAPQNIHQTNPSPVQNALTMTRAEATDPGEATQSPVTPPSTAETRRLSGPATAEDAAPDERTVEDFPLAFMATKASPDPLALTSPSRRPKGGADQGRIDGTTLDPDAPVPVAAMAPTVDPHIQEATSPCPPPVDRDAPTRSPEPIPVPFGRTDTEEVPTRAVSAVSADPSSDDDRFQETELPDSGARLEASRQSSARERGQETELLGSGTRRPVVARSLARAPMSSSNGVAMERPSSAVAASRTAELRWSIAAGIVTASALVAVYAHFALRPSTTAAVAEPSAAPTASPMPTAAITRPSSASAPAVAATAAPSAPAMAPDPAPVAPPSPPRSPVALPVTRPSPTRPPSTRDDLVREFDPPASTETPRSVPDPPPKRRLPGSGL